MPERKLDDDELYRASWAFEKTLAYSKVRVDSKLGIGDRPYTTRYGSNYYVHMGPQFFANIFGYVRYSDFSPAKWINVKAWRSPQALEAKTQTDKEGLFELKGLKAGSFRVQFETPAKYTGPHWNIMSSLQEVGNGELWRLDAVVGENVYPLGFPHRDMRDYGVLVHELMHVWQGQHGKHFLVEAAGCQIEAVLSKIPVFGILFDRSPYDDYKFTKDWDDMNVEAQAQLVEDWYREGCPEYGNKYPYVRDQVLKDKA